jgi:hypothetical protein
MRGRRGTLMRALVLLAVLAVALLALAQLLLPGIAASRISSRVGRYGHVLSVHVSAWPALELLWGSADSVRVRAGTLKLTPAQSAKLLWEGRGVDRLDVSAPSVMEGTLRMSDVRLRKRARELSASASLSQQDVRAALPAGLDVRLLGSAGGQVRVLAGGGLFGLGASLEAIAGASQGALIARPAGVPGAAGALGTLGAGLRITLFADPHVYVEGVGARVQHSAPLTYLVTMRARLR